MLTVKEIDNAERKAKPYKLGDGGGLYLEVRANGSKYWRMKFRMTGKEMLLSFGVYPEVRPPEARAKAKEARDLIGAFPPAVEKHFASITEPAKVAVMLCAFDGFSGTFPVQCALKLAPLLIVRPGELRNAEWAHLVLDKAECRYSVSNSSTRLRARTGLSCAIKSAISSKSSLATGKNSTFIACPSGQRFPGQFGRVSRQRRLRRECLCRCQRPFESRRVKPPGGKALPRWRFRSVDSESALNCSVAGQSELVSG